MIINKWLYGWYFGKRSGGQTKKDEENWFRARTKRVYLSKTNKILYAVFNIYRTKQ